MAPPCFGGVHLHGECVCVCASVSRHAAVHSTHSTAHHRRPPAPARPRAGWPGAPRCGTPRGTPAGRPGRWPSRAWGEWVGGCSRSFRASSCTARYTLMRTHSRPPTKKPAAPPPSHHPPRLLLVGRKRLLAEDVLPRPQRRGRPPAVEAVGQSDVDGVEGRVVQEGLVGGVGFGEAAAVGEGFGWVVGCSCNVVG
jgi:hypothetical protein